MFNTCATSRVDCNLQPLSELTTLLSCTILRIRIASRKTFQGQRRSVIRYMEG